MEKIAKAPTRAKLEKAHVKADEKLREHLSSTPPANAKRVKLLGYLQRANQLATIEQAAWDALNPVQVPQINDAPLSEQPGQA